jgi:hypothetical protein
MIDGKIIEQVTEFNYLGSKISECKKDMEYKLQTYTRMNGIIKRNFGKQMSNQTKLRIHNITAKTALKYGNETSMLNKRDKQRLEAAQIRFLRSLLGYTKLDRQRNVDIRERLRVQSIVEEIQTYQRKWKERIDRMQDKRPPKLALKCQPVGKRNRGHSKKRLKDQFLEES